LIALVNDHALIQLHPTPILNLFCHTRNSSALQAAVEESTMLLPPKTYANAHPFFQVSEMSELSLFNKSTQNARSHNHNAPKNGDPTKQLFFHAKAKQGLCIIQFPVNH
jgi:hypothetical protein